MERTPDGGFVPRSVGQIHGTISQDIRKISLIKKRKDSPTKMTSSAPLALLGSRPDSVKNTPSGSASESDSSVRKSPRSLAAKKLNLGPAGKITESGSIVRKDPPQCEEKSNEPKLKRRRLSSTQETNYAASISQRGLL